MNRVVLLTGASGKIGRVFLRHLLQKGCVVIGTASSTDSLKLLIQEENLLDKNFYGVVIDLCDDDSAEKITHFLMKEKLFPDCLINNARSRKFLEVQSSGISSRENFEREYLLDVIVPYELTYHLLSYSNKLKTIINIGSQYGTVAMNPGLYQNPAIETPVQYSVAKAGLHHLTRELSVRLAKSNIQVNCIAFGGIEGRTDDTFVKKYSEMLPLGRMLVESELTCPLDMLLSENSSPMTGQIINYDGGWTIW